MIVYAAILVAAQGLGSGTAPIVSFTAIPLIIIAILLIRDLMRKTTDPTMIEKPYPINRTPPPQDQSESLRQQLNITSKSSASYFDDVIRTRLRNLIVTKASLETGIETGQVRHLLTDPIKGPAFLHDEQLYRLLYSATPKDGEDRMRMVLETIELIENWKA